MQADPRPELLVDPAMLAGGPEDDSEYEYEYDGTDTETFYVTVDLTSCNGILRPPRRRTEPLTTSPSASSPGVARIDARPSHLDIQNAAAAEESDSGLSPNRFQLLDFSGLNPIVSYQNQIFSCSWADMIGTELLFTDADRQTEPSDLTLLKREKEFNLLSASSVKLVGQKANLLTSSGKAIQNASAHDAAATRTVQTPQQQPQPARNIAPRNGRQTDQALFLERLMNAKQAKNENDIVRTVFSMRRGPNFDGRLQGWARTEKRMTEVQNLNRAMLQGDMDALMALERIYAQVDDNNNNNNHNNDAVTDSSSTRPSG